MLELSHVTFQYAPNQGIMDASFSVSPGEVIGVVGGNGAGKSTLLGLVSAAMVPQSGTLTLSVSNLAGRLSRLRSDSGIAYRRRVGYLTELAPVYEEMSVVRYLRFRAKLRGERFLRIRRRVQDAMNLCGLANLRKARLSELSLGLRKRVALAEAILTLPALLVLDDPFAGIDATLRKEFAKIIREVSVRSHVLISGHDPQMLAECCTRFVLIEEGCVRSDSLTSDEAMYRLAMTAERKA